MKLIFSYHDQKVWRQQPLLAGRCKTSTPCVSYTDTHSLCISMTDSGNSELLRVAYFRRGATNRTVAF
jgi:hypothetical protein